MADVRERYNDQEEGIRIANDRADGRNWTSMPVKVTQDSDGHTCKLQIVIKGWGQSPRTGQMEPVEISPVGLVPIHFAAGGGLTITHPVKENDEGIGVFQSRAIDLWWRDGGIQPEPDGWRRRHHLSDPIYIPGVRNKKRQLDPKPAADAVHIRLDGGEQYIELHKDGSCTVYATKVNLHAPEITMDGNERQIEGEDGDKHYGRDKEQDTKVEIKGTLHVTKTIDADDQIRSKDEVIAKMNGNNYTQLSRHVHQNSGGEGVGGPPLPGS
jgi:Phage protein Gp138 N-terminal domain